jgi:hypothetical protein
VDPQWVRDRLLTAFTDFHEVHGPVVIFALGRACMAAQLSSAVFIAQTVQNDPDILLRSILVTRSAFNVFDDLLDCAVRFQSNHPLFFGYDPPRTLF